MHVLLTLGVFFLTLILMFVRPRGLSEAWAAVTGAALMLGLGLVTWRDAWATTAQGADVLLFLFALMLFSGLLDQSGFFEWAAVLAARAADGRARTLFRNLFLLGFATTALLSLDTTAIILTPIVLAFVARLRLTAKPYLLACAFVANTGSLLLPVSNLTNLLFVSGLQLGFARFALVMALPQLAALAANYLIFRQLFRAALESQFETESLPSPMSVVPDRAYFGAALATLALVLIGYFFSSLAGVPPYIVALCGCAVLLIVGSARHRVEWKRIGGEIAWPLFPFVAGLFVVIRGVENLGLARIGTELVDSAISPLGHVLAAAFGAAIGTNLINNIPMALVSIAVVRHAGASLYSVYGALLGCNIGPNLTLTGSLATMLVITSARKRGEEVGAKDFFRAGIVATPLILFAGAIALWLVLAILR